MAARAVEFVSFIISRYLDSEKVMSEFLSESASNIPIKSKILVNALKVIGEAGIGAEAVRLAHQLKPDIVLLLLDQMRHPGLEVLRDLNSGSENAPRVILLTSAAGGEQIVEALQLGVHGVVLLDTSVELLCRIIHTAMKGVYWLRPESVSRLVEYLRTLPPSKEEQRAGVVERARVFRQQVRIPRLDASPVEGEAQ